VADFDVIVVGASIAGCTAATLLGRQGLRVALFEAHRDPAMYKRMCTHYIQSSALPVMQRLGVVAELDRRGAVHNHGDFWTSFGWVRESDRHAGCPPYGISVRREVLDPLLRATAAAEPTVELMLGTKVRDLLRDDEGRVVGVTATGSDTDHELELRARYVVAADGKSSRLAEAAQLRAETLPNGRFAYFAQYRGVSVPGAPRSKLWLTDTGDAVYAFPNDDGVTVLATMPLKSRLAAFKAQGPEAALLASYDGLPEGPDLTHAERVSDVIGTLDYPNVLRKRITVPGLALVGDAAMTGDPLWGVGCGWAFQSAAWLADELAAALCSGDDPDRAARRYARRHRRRLRPHFTLTSSFSSGRPFNPLERLLYGAAPHDPVVAEAFWRYGTRNAAPTVLVRPNVLVRAALARRRSAHADVPAQRTAAADVPSNRVTR
jgi:2-polyprenyl-6-methoxyphenol hydroxylase-like FAD-dependent oxidoreductase